MAEVKDTLQVLRDRLDQVDDERAEAFRIALSGKTWYLAAVLAGQWQGRVSDGGQLERLCGLSRLPASAAGGVDSAAAGSVKAMALAALLAAALEHHSSHRDGDCPVCGRSEAMTPRRRPRTRRRRSYGPCQRSLLSRHPEASTLSQRRNRGCAGQSCR
jgi:hypothetical protein